MQYTNSPSLFLLEWFCTKYARDYNTVINGTFHVYQEYTNEVASNDGKIHFEFFARYGKVKNDDGLTTSPAQIRALNWARRNGVMDYLSSNLNRVT